MKILDVPKSGSMGGTTASHNRAGQYLRNRRKPTTPTRTVWQSRLRSRFGAASRQWRTLTTDLQNAWTAFAAGFPVKDSLGQSIVLTGQQYYVGVTTSLLNAGLVPITTTPAVSEVSAPDSPSCYVDDSGTVVVEILSCPPTEYVLMALSKPQSNGRNFCKAFHQFTVCSANALLVDVSDLYAATYGVPTVGQKLFEKATSMNSAGMTGPGLISQTPVQSAPTTITPGVLAVHLGIASLSGVTPTEAAAALFEFDDVSGTWDSIDQQPVTGGTCTFTPTLENGKLYRSRTMSGSKYSAPSNQVTNV